MKPVHDWDHFFKLRDDAVIIGNRYSALPTIPPLCNYGLAEAFLARDQGKKKKS